MQFNIKQYSHLACVWQGTCQLDRAGSHSCSYHFISYLFSYLKIEMNVEAVLAFESRLRFNLQAKQGNFFRMLGICLASPTLVFSTQPAD